MSFPGGIGRVTANKANYWKRKGHNVSIITDIQGHNPDFYELVKGINRFDLGFHKKGISQRIYKHILWNYRLKRILEKIVPDIVVYTIFTRPVKCSFNYKSVLECHFNHDVNKILAKIYNYPKWKVIVSKFLTMRNEWLATKYDAFCVLTEEDCKLWQSRHIYNNISVVPNMQSFVSERPALLEEKKVIAIGRFDAQKSFDRLIKIWKIVDDECGDWQLNIYGQGIDYGKYKKLIEMLGLSKSVILHKPTKKVQEALMASSLLCFTSTYEGFSMVLIEAMSCGLPVISYNTPCGPKDIIVNGHNGFLIEDGDENCYAQKIIEIVNKTSIRKRMGQCAYEDSLQYSLDNVMARWEKIFNRLML